MKILSLLLILTLIANIESRTRKPGKSVNLALETVLEFDEKDFHTDTKIINDVQSFLNKVKTALQQRKPSRRSNNENDFKLTDFLENAIIVLKSYKNKDLNEIFTALNDEMRKYHYKGCKFHELLESFSFREFLSKKLNELKNSSANDLRKQLDIYLEYLRTSKKDKTSKYGSFLNFVNSLYSAQDFSQNMTYLLEQIKTYNSPIEKSDNNLSKLVQQVIRTVLFERYSNLNANVRKDVKKHLKDYWNDYIGNGNIVDVPKINSAEFNKKKFTTRNIITTSAKKATEALDVIPTKKSKVKISKNAEKIKTLGQLSRIDLSVYDNKHRPAMQALRSRPKLKPLKPVQLTTEAKPMQTLWVEERSTTKKLLWDDDYEDETDDQQKNIKGNEQHKGKSKVKQLDKDYKENGKAEKSGSTYSNSYENSGSQEKGHETSSYSDGDSALRTKKHKKSKKSHGKSHSKSKKSKHSSVSTSDSSEEIKKKKHHKKSHNKSNKRSHKKKKGHKKKALRIGNTETTTTTTQDDIAVAHKVIMAKKVVNKSRSAAVKSKMATKKIANDREKSEFIKNKSKKVSHESSEYSSSESLEKDTDLGDKSITTKDEKEDNITENDRDNASSSSESEPETESEILDKTIESEGDKKSTEGSDEITDKSLETSQELESVTTVNKANVNESEISIETGDEKSRKQIPSKQRINNHGKNKHRVSASEEGLSIERSDLRKSNKNDTFTRKLDKVAEKVVSKRINALEKELETMKHRLKEANITVDAKKARRFKIVKGPTKDTLLNETTTKSLTEIVATNNPETISRETLPTAKSLASTIKFTTKENSTALEKTPETTAVTFVDKPHLRADNINEIVDNTTERNTTNDYSYEDYPLTNTDRVEILQNIEKSRPGEKGSETSQPITMDNGQNSSEKSVSIFNDNKKNTAYNMALNATEDIRELFTTGDPVTDTHGNNLDALLAAPNATMIIPFGKVTDSESDTLKKMGVGNRNMDLLDLANEPDLAAVMQSPFGDLI